MMSTKPVIIIYSKQLLHCGMLPCPPCILKLHKELYKCELGAARHGKNWIITVRSKGLLDMTGLAQ